MTATVDGEPVGETLTIDNGTAITFAAENATSIEVTAGENAPVIFTGETAVWTPEICNEQQVSVIAKRIADDEETQTSDPLTFTLTVKKAVPVITADWVITGAPLTSSGKVDVILNKGTNSSQGDWRAVATFSYSSSINGGAQLGSKNNPFKSGTISLEESDIPENAVIKEVIFTGTTTGSHTLTISVNGVNSRSFIVADVDASESYKISNINLTGNKIVFTEDENPTNYLCVKGITVKYALPEKKPGDITANFTKQYCLDIDDTETELTVMAGTTLTFSSADAARMEITTEDDVELPEAVATDAIAWTVPAETVATITVTAYSEFETQTSSKEYVILAEEVTPAVPEFILDEDSKTVMISTEAGALMLTAYPYVEDSEKSIAPLTITPQEWAFTEGDTPREYEFSYDGIDGVMTVNIKSVTPLAESETVEFYLDNDGTVSAIDNIAADADSTLQAVYYNLQGQRVTPAAAGLYIRCQNGRAEKTLLR